MVSIINIVSSKQNSLYQGLSIKHTSKNKKRTYHLKKSKTEAEQKSSKAAVLFSNTFFKQFAS